MSLIKQLEVTKFNGASLASLQGKYNRQFNVVSPLEPQELTLLLHLFFFFNFICRNEFQAARRQLALRLAQTQNCSKFSIDEKFTTSRVLCEQPAP